MATNKPKLTTAVDLTESDETAQKKKGRPQNENRLPWAEAREFIRSQQIASRTQYEAWFAREQPKTLPRFPYRVYKEWTSWNDFLGNDNKFNEKAGTKWRPLLDVIPYIHSLKIGTQAEWLEYYRLNKDDNEQLKEIPARPDLVYNDWRSWGHFLGNKPVEAIEARQEAQRVRIYSIIHYPEDPGNVFFYGVDPNPSAFKERYQDQKFDIIKTYWYDPQYADRINAVVEQYSTQWGDLTRQRLTPNVYDITWYLDQMMEPVLRGQV